jgi:uncharacterized protein YneF (UPF0154 family)
MSLLLAILAAWVILSFPVALLVGPWIGRKAREQSRAVEEVGG